MDEEMEKLKEQYTGKWGRFPPTEEDRKRLAMYDKYAKIYETDHEEVFERAKLFLKEVANPAKTIYIPVNICSLISNKQADFLFEEDIVVKSQLPKDEGGAEVNDAIQGIFERSMLMPDLHSGEVTDSAQGGVALKVRYSPGEDGEEQGAYIECMPPGYFFPDVDPRNVKRYTSAKMAFVQEEENEDGTIKRTLHREIHWPGNIATDAWVLEDDGRVGDQTGETEYIETGYDGILLFYIPNQRLTGQFWGRSDYKPLEAMQDELNLAVSMLGMVLNKYSEPLMAVPEGSLEDGTEVILKSVGIGTDPLLERLGPVDYAFRKLAAIAAHAKRDENVLRVDTTVFEAQNGSEEILKYLPRFIEWSADLASRIRQINDILLKLIMLVGETNGIAIGLEQTGTPESGYALRIRMSTPLAKIKRKMQYWDPALKNAFHAALTLEVKNGMHSFEPERPTIIWPDGLPEDEAGQLDMTIRKKSAGLISFESAVAEANKGLEGEALDSEIEAIRTDREEARQASTVADPFDRLSSSFTPEEDADGSAGE